MITFQEMILRLSDFWAKQGAIIHQGYDLETGAGTFNPATFLRALGPEPYNTAYVEPSRRPKDGRYGTNPNRIQHYFQYQVILKPSPTDIQTIYLKSLEAIGFDLKKHDVRFVHDDWEGPTLGAWGLGWETWIDGMEVSQITYFQAVAGLTLKPITGEITYGLERLAMYLQKKDSIFDLQWNQDVKYGDIYLQNEVEWSSYNFDEADTEMWLKHFNDYEREAKRLIQKKWPLPAYDFVVKASHAFNLLDARGVISVTERTGYITRIRELAKLVGEAYIQSREEKGYPLLKKKAVKEEKPSFPPPYLKEAQADFLLEIGSEELPASFVMPAVSSLKDLLTKFLENEGISYQEIHAYGTPRRLAVLIEALQTEKSLQVIEKKGPSLQAAFLPDGSPTNVGKGFLQSFGKKSMTLQEIEKSLDPEIEIRTIKEAKYLFAKKRVPSQNVAEILKEELPKLILQIEFPKKMRWADLDISFARPILWIVTLFGNEIIPFQLGNIQSDRKTRGHRQLSPESISLKEPKEYLHALKTHFVMASVQERRDSILKQLKEIEEKLQAKVIEKEKVIREVLFLVEWPYLTEAYFNQDFLRAPKELLVSEMVEHQRYFPIENREGGLLNSFIITANNIPSDQIREGNCRVLSARLADGVFLYELDLKTSLDQWNEKLKKMTFQKELGTVFEKVERLKKHVVFLAPYFPEVELNEAIRAAELSKADLATHTVGEFPDLQGTMGKYYAKLQGESPSVALSIEESWMPRGEKSPLPASPLGALVSLADKFDNLIGYFAVGLKPTSSSDPYALRRQVLGIIRILIQHRIHLPLKETLKACMSHFLKKFPEKEVLDSIHEFILNRIKTVFQEFGFKSDEIEAALAPGVYDIYDTYLRIEALHDFRQKPEFEKLYEVYKRARGQLQDFGAQTLTPSLLKEPAEIALFQANGVCQKELLNHINRQSYASAFATLPRLQPPLAQLFDEVKVLDDDPSLCSNRIALLQEVFSLFSKLLDFGKIQFS